MNCPYDLKEYALGESSREEAQAIRAHAAECAVCRDEIARLELTQAALLSLREEEMPRRIAFVSDKVFEPRWYERLWNSGPRLGFLGASMLAAAILVHGFAARPAVAPPPSATARIDTQAIEQQVERKVAERLDAAVAKAVSDSESRQQKRTVELLQAAEQRYDFDRRATLAAFSEQTRILQQQVSNIYIAANNMKAGE